MGLKVGDRVKLAQLAFDNGVYKNTPENRALRGTIHHNARDPDAVNVLWDGRKTPLRFWHAFINRAAKATP